MFLSLLATIPVAKGQVSQLSPTARVDTIHLTQQLFDLDRSDISDQHQPVWDSICHEITLKAPVKVGVMLTERDHECSCIDITMRRAHSIRDYIRQYGLKEADFEINIIRFDSTTHVQMHEDRFYHWPAIDLVLYVE